MPITSPNIDWFSKFFHCRHSSDFVTNWSWDIIQQRVYQTSAGCEWFDAASDWCVGWSGTERYWRCHWLAVQASSCLPSSHRRTFWILTVTQISQNVQIKFKFIVKTFLSYYHQFPDIYVSRGNVAMRLRCYGIFNDHFIVLLSLLVKKQLPLLWL